MKKIFGAILSLSILATNIIPLATLGADRFSSELNDSVSEVRDHLEISPVQGGGHGEGVKELMFFIAQKLMIPASILIGVLVAIIGFYKMMFTDKEDQQKKGRDFLLWGVVGILLMMSAYYIGMRLVGSSGISGEILNFDDMDGFQIATKVYSNIIYPLLRVAMYLIMGIMFIILFIHAYRMMLSPADDTGKKSTRIVIWNVIGIIVIIFAKNLVELVYGSRGEFQGGSTLGMSEGILDNSADKVGFLHLIINWVLGFVAFIVLVIIIYQSLMLATKPDDADTLKKMGKNFIYVFVGILIIGAGYLITNFFIVKEGF